MIGAPKAARTTYEQFGMEYPIAEQDKLEASRGTAEQAEELQEREKDMLLRWLNNEVGRENLLFTDKQTAEIAITRLLISLCREWYGKQLAPRGGRP